MYSMGANQRVKTDDVNMDCEGVNPFYHRPKWTLHEYFKIFLYSFTLLPLRLIGMGLAFLFMYITVIVAFWFGKETYSVSKTLNNADPLNGTVYRKLTTFLDIVNRIYLWICGFHHVIIIGNPCPHTKILVCAPHSTFADSIVVMLPHLKSIVAKSSARTIPFIGTLVSFLQPIWVERDESNSRRAAVVQITERVNHEKLSKPWPQICIFPEGTCTNRKALISFKKGAFYPGFPVQPVTIKYTNKCDTLTWTWDGPNTLLVLWWSLCQPSLKIEIEYLPVYHPNDSEKNDPSLYAENVRTIMANHLGVPKSNFNYEHCKQDLKRRQAIERFQKVHSIRECPLYLRTIFDLYMELQEIILHFNHKYFNFTTSNNKNLPNDNYRSVDKSKLEVSNLRRVLRKYYVAQTEEGLARSNGPRYFNDEAQGDLLFRQLAKLFSEIPAPPLQNGSEEKRNMVNDLGVTDMGQVSLAKLLTTIFLARARYINDKPFSQDSENHLLHINKLDVPLFHQIFKQNYVPEIELGRYTQLCGCLLDYLYTITDDKIYIEDCFSSYKDMIEKFK